MIVARQELTQKYNEEIHELERELDKNVSILSRGTRGRFLFAQLFTGVKHTSCKQTWKQVVTSVFTSC